MSPALTLEGVRTQRTVKPISFLRDQLSLDIFPPHCSRVFCVLFEGSVVFRVVNQPQRVALSLDGHSDWWGRASVEGRPRGSPDQAAQTLDRSASRDPGPIHSLINNRQRSRPRPRRPLSPNRLLPSEKPNAVFPRRRYFPNCLSQTLTVMEHLYHGFNKHLFHFLKTIAFHRLSFNFL